MIHKFFSRQLKCFDQFLCKTKSHHYVAVRSFRYKDEEVPTVTLSDIKELLKSSNSILSEGHACMTTNFVLCKDNRRKECKIHVNKITGMKFLEFLIFEL